MVVDTEAISEKFYELGMELVHSLSTIPVNLMDISIELKEQVELVKLQEKRAKPFVDPAELKLRKEINTPFRRAGTERNHRSKQIREHF